MDEFNIFNIAEDLFEDYSMIKDLKTEIVRIEFCLLCMINELHKIKSLINELINRRFELIKRLQ